MSWNRPAAWLTPATGDGEPATDLTPVAGNDESGAGNGASIAARTGGS